MLDTRVVMGVISARGIGEEAVCGAVTDLCCADDYGSPAVPFGECADGNDHAMLVAEVGVGAAVAMRGSDEVLSVMVCEYGVVTACRDEEDVMEPPSCSVGRRRSV